MIADSSFIISFFTPDDENHGKAIQMARKEAGQVFVIPDRVLEETVTAMTYKRGPIYAVELMKEIQENRQFIVRPTREEEIKSAFARMGQIPRKISFIDYLVIELSVALRTPLLSFDRQLNSLRRLIG